MTEGNLNKGEERGRKRWVGEGERERSEIACVCV